MRALSVLTFSASWAGKSQPQPLGQCVEIFLEKRALFFFVGGFRTLEPMQSFQSSLSLASKVNQPGAFFYFSIFYFIFLAAAAAAESLKSAQPPK